MNALSLDGLSSTGSSLSPATVDTALEPASVRNGDQTAKSAYQAGLAFEQLLVNQLAQQLTATASSADDGSDDSSDGGGGSAGGLMGSDPASSTYAQMLPQALTTGVMSAGGLGIAAQIAASIDPAVKAPTT
jgi:Rod binding domain-containing protein